MHACIITYWVCISVLYSVCTPYESSILQRSAAQCSALLYCTAVYIKPTPPIRHQQQATTASHTRCHKLGAGCCLDSPSSPDKESGHFFATSEAQSAKRQKKQKGGFAYIHTYEVHSLHTEYFVLGVTHILRIHIRTSLPIA